MHSSDLVAIADAECLEAQTYAEYWYAILFSSLPDIFEQANIGLVGGMPGSRSKDYGLKASDERFRIDLVFIFDVGVDVDNHDVGCRYT